MKKHVVVAICLGLFASTVLTVINSPSLRSKIKIKNPFQSATPKQEIILSEIGVQPKLIRIPALNLSAPIIGLGIDNKGEFASPNDPSEVGWYLGSGYPGLGDSNWATLLDGHLTAPNGQPAVFASLDKLKINDRLQIEREDGLVFHYRIAEINNRAPADIDMEKLISNSDLGQEGVNIITCAGNYDQDLATYEQRLVVRAVLENPQ